jgi:hypothetical protein
MASDGMNAPAVFGLGDTAEFCDEAATNATSLGMGRDGQMPQLYFGISGRNGNQSTDGLSMFLGQPFEFLSFETECAADIARQTQRLPQNHPKEFIQPGGGLDCGYDFERGHASCLT